MVSKISVGAKKLAVNINTNGINSKSEYRDILKFVSVIPFTYQRNKGPTHTRSAKPEKINNGSR
ncbi:hypothetical protein [Kordia sp.]|uniref:hypothetical protein n=1 Tax=Kordia sp. TaxID=1965332 RepID=UPI003B5B38B3